MSERLNNNPNSFENKLVNGRIARVNDASPKVVRLDSEPATAMIDRVEPATNSAAEAPAPQANTIEAIDAKLKQLKVVAEALERRYGDNVPKEYTDELNAKEHALTTERIELVAQRDAEQQQAAINDEILRKQAEINRRREELAAEFARKQAELDNEVNGIKSAAEKKLQQFKADDELIGNFFGDTTAKSAEAPHVTHIPSVQAPSFDEAETMFFNGPLVVPDIPYNAVAEPHEATHVQQPEYTEEDAAEVVAEEDAAEVVAEVAAAEVVAEVAAAAIADDRGDNNEQPQAATDTQQPAKADTLANGPFAQKPNLFESEPTFKPVEGLQLATKGRSEKVRETGEAVSKGVAKLAGSAAHIGIDAARIAFEKAKLPKNRHMIKIGSGVIAALVLTTGGIFVKNKVDDHREKVAIEEQQTAAAAQETAANAELAAKIFPSCNEIQSINAFQKPWLTHTYDAVAGITFFAQDGATQADNTVHSVGPNSELTNSIYIINNGEVRSQVCDDDSNPAITIDGKNVTVDANKLTAVSSVIDSNPGVEHKYSAPPLQNAKPTADNSLTQADIDEFRTLSVNDAALRNGLAQAIEAITDTLRNDDKLVQDNVKTQLAKQAQKLVAQRLKQVNKSEKYTVTASGDNPTNTVIDFVSPSETKKTMIKPQDVRVKITK